MAPSLQEHNAPGHYEKNESPSRPGEEVVISGVSTRLPGCHNIMEFADKLYGKENMVKCGKNRWSRKYPGISDHHGTIPNVDQFDAQFFMVFQRLSHMTCAMGRKLLELSYEAVFDAGVCPTELSGKSVGVFVTTGFPESERTCTFDELYFAMIGTSTAMSANRISYYLNLKGPSIHVNADAAGSAVALEKAYSCIMSGQCEAAIVGGAKLLLHPQSSLNYDKEIPLSADGNVKSFDMNADGHSLSEGVSVLFLQKHKDAKRYGKVVVGSARGRLARYHPPVGVWRQVANAAFRQYAGKPVPFSGFPGNLATTLGLIFVPKARLEPRVSPVYASIRHIRTGFTPYKEGEPQHYGPPRDSKILKQILSEFYADANVSPSDVEYVEGYGSGISEADKAELEAIDEVFCVDRKSVFPVGSVMSNTGCTDASHCLTAILKLILAYSKGTLAANINYTNPRDDVAGIREGRMRILTEETSFGRTLTAINNFSITGINTHVLLQGHYKKKNLSKYASNVPHLVVASGRQEAAVQRILDVIKDSPFDPEHIGLLHNVFKTRILNHLARGYGIFSTNDNETVTLKEMVNYYDDAKHPLWFVYSGMGSQWCGMGAQLMRIPIFADAIHRCHKVLEQKGVDLINIITSPDQAMFDNILNSFVGIAAIQIGLTDILKAIGLVPDKIIGHSVGELGCAYADGCVTAEEMILMAYSRGLVSRETPFIQGSMAAVGIGYIQVSKLLPDEIEVACHNGPHSSTLSGPSTVMKKFVGQLTAQGIFAKEVPCSNIAYHSRYIAGAGPGLLKYLEEVVTSPKPRSERWLSTSVPQDKWNEPYAKYSSAEYHTNNLLNPVLFEEVLKLVPHNACLVEIAPHGLLQAILKRSLPDTCRHVQLTRRGHQDSALFLLEAIGNLYMEGYDVDVSALYPKIEFPVSTETRPLSHLVEWAYTEKLKVCQYVMMDKITNNAVYKPIISVYDDEHKYITGNIIDGRRVYPYSGALILAWETLAATIGKNRDHLSVQFKDITFHVQPPLHDNKTLNLTVTLQRGSGRFEVCYDHGIVADGYITAISTFHNLPKNLEPDDDPMELTNDDIYKLFFERGYKYKNEFRSIHKSNMSFTYAQFLWKDNWVTFLDGALQFNVLRRNHKGITEPRYIKSVSIDTLNHISEVSHIKRHNGVVDAVFSKVHNVFRCGGLVIEHVSYKDIPNIVRHTVSLKELKFVPYNMIGAMKHDILEPLYVYLQIVAENLNKTALNVFYVNDSIESCILKKIEDLLNSPPHLDLNLIAMKNNKAVNLKDDNVKPDVLLLYHDNEVFDEKNMEHFSNTFIINIGEPKIKNYPDNLYHQICVTGRGKDAIELAKWRPTKSAPGSAAISVRDQADLEHLRATKDELSVHNKLLILTAYPSPVGLKEFVQEWRAEKNCNVFVVMINRHYANMDDLSFPKFDLVFNVLENGTWGGEYYVPIKEETVSRNTATLQISRFGDLNSMSWIEAPNIEKNGIKVKVQYAGLNVYDARRALAEISIKDSDYRGFGMDFSGVTERGYRVMGLVKGGAVSSEVLAQPELLWPVPQHWSLEDAATVPLPYCLAFYCLTIKSRLVCGMNILIEGGSGALGQAAISICLANKCNVFTSVSNVHKKRFLLKMFPDLTADHIGNSRDRTFQDMVMEQTDGVGCDIVICSSTGELKKASLRCCAASGITIDTVLIHTEENFAYGMFNMTKARSYTVIDFPSIFTKNGFEDLKKLQLMVSEGISRGYVRPLSRVTYSPQDISRGIRLLAASRHTGRVLISLQERLPDVRLKLNCSPNACYLIFFDDDDFGLQWADRLIKNHVKKLFIHCRRFSSYLHFKITMWRKNNIQVYSSHEKLSKKDLVSNILKDCIRWAPIEGIFVLRTSCDNLRESTEAKNLVSNLDTASRELCPTLRYFSIISECGLGQEICLNRVHDMVISTSIKLHQLEKYEDIKTNNDIGDEESLNWQSALDGIEQAIIGKKTNVLVYNQPLKRRCVTEELSNITGIKFEDNKVLEDITFKEIGIDDGKAQEFSNILKQKFDIIISKEDILQLSVATLKKLQDNITNNILEPKGLSAFINYIDSDELLASCNFVQVPTLVNTREVRPEEFNNELTYLCIVPGIEGHHNRFSKLCERLKLPALVLQPGFDYSNETIPDIAQRLANVIIKNLVLNGHFYLLGYEVGILIAMEIAQILEKRGLTGTIYCLGGTPDEICAFIKTEFSVNLEKIENDLIEYIYSFITNRKSDQLSMKIKNAEDWEKKVEIFMRVIYGQCSFTKQYIQAFMNVIYNRIKMARDYNTNQQEMKSKVVVLKTNLPTVAMDSLSGYHQIYMHELDTSLPNSVQDLRCSAIVNKYLEQEILNTYHNQNHCETALATGNKQFTTDYLDDD